MKSKFSVGGITNLVTIEQARLFCAELAKRGIGNGVAKEILGADGKPDLEAWAASGIYILPWDIVQGAPEPGSGEAAPYQVHFNNGVANMNIGLLMDEFKHGRSVENTFGYIKSQVDEMAKYIKD